MPTSADFAQERHELERVLASGIFSRAPNLAQLLTYVCSKYFEGTAEQIKEYNIAVDALGRSPEFDQKRDSIVRVEAHRLRKRLREYYDSDGADHPVRIEIPPGQYAPQFLPQAAPVASLSPVAVVAQGEAVANGEALTGPAEPVHSEESAPADRIAQEAAELAVRADEREELDRLGSHVAAARALMADDAAAGRRLIPLPRSTKRL